MGATSVIVPPILWLVPLVGLWVQLVLSHFDLEAEAPQLCLLVLNPVETIVWMISFIGWD